MSILAASKPAAIVPGYAAELWSSPPIIARLLRLFLLFGFSLLACEQLALVGPRLYLAAFGASVEQGFRVAVVGCLLLGGGVAYRRKSTAYAATALQIAAAAMVVGVYARFFAFDGPAWQSFAACLPGLVAAAALGFGVTQARQAARRWLQLGDGTWLFLNTWAPLAFVAALILAAIASNLVGPLRAGLALAGGLLAAATVIAPRAASPAALRRRLAVMGGSYAALCLLALGTERICPLERVLANVQPLIYLRQDADTRLEVTAGQGGLHYFIDGRLRFSSLDEKRWAQSLALPGLVRLRNPRQALVLSLGEGLIERELLAFAPDLRITSVMRSRTLADASLRQWFLRRLTGGSMGSPRVSRIERDPAVYVRDLAQQRFDLIVIDLPDPEGPREHKYYTRRFYASLAAHLNPDGILTVQAASARRSPRSFATVGATLSAAGLTTTPMTVPLMTRGEWCLYLATKGPLPSVVSSQRYLTTFPGSIEPHLMTIWPDSLPPKDFVALPNTQHDARLMDWFDYESSQPNHE